MKIVIKIVAFILGIAAIGIVVWLGYQTVANQTPIQVAVFGISSAIVAPLGLTLIGYSLKRPSEEDLIKRLARVPELDKLIKEASNQEEKIRLLEQQKAQLADVVILETRRQSLISRKELLENDALRLVNELDAIEAEMANLDLGINSNDHIALALKGLRERIDARRKGELVFTFRETNFRLESAWLTGLPGGELISPILISIFRGIERLFAHIDKRRR